MGVPAFFRWLLSRFKESVLPVEEATREGVDHLYLDMNGIIHPCCHPDRNAPKTEAEMIRRIFKYIDEIVDMIKPRKMLYMAIDGVAPRAKMNQQRARRFVSARDLERKKAMRTGNQSASTPELWDSNVITPGTPFMEKVATALRFYIRSRLETHPVWKNLEVVLSDSNVPGEGEHKIMDFVRTTRSKAGYDPNTCHVLYGLDADLIMLGLATHEPNFFILREYVAFYDRRKCTGCGRTGHTLQDCRSTTPAPMEITENDSKTEASSPNVADVAKKFEVVSIAVVREYLARDLKVNPESLPFEWNLERVIDDFVFMCFFVGNDFLPQLPTLQIQGGSLDNLMALYVHMLPALGGYLCDGGDVNLTRVDVLMSEIGAQEANAIRAHAAKRRRTVTGAAWMDGRAQRAANFPRSNAPGKRLKTDGKSRKDNSNAQDSETNSSKTETSTSSSNLTTAEISFLPDEAKSTSSRQKGSSANDSECQKDAVMGYNARYYKEKFGYDKAADADKLKRLYAEYVKGLCWVMKYYYSGCPSWGWYFPAHYAPLSSDLINMDLLPGTNEFRLGEPFCPLAQLMGVLPKRSSHCLPESLRDLMCSSKSPLSEFYPTEFDIDMNGKRQEWQAVVKLSFIDEEKLL
eukprot:638726_1